MEPSQGILSKLMEVQSELKVKKGQWNKHSKFYYRSKEDILEAAKPILHGLGLVLLMDDNVTERADGWVYVVSTATIADVESGVRLSATGWARESWERKGMDASQITGTASSYAGKRALGNLFAIDDTEDSDAMSGSAESPDGGPVMGRCAVCGTVYQFANTAQMQSSMCACGGTEFTAVQ